MRWLLESAREYGRRRQLFPARLLFSLPHASATSVSFLFAKRRCLDGQKIKTSDVDSGRCAHLENLRQKEDTSIKHCSLPKTIRGGYSAKGLQPWAVPRFTSLMLGLFGPQDLSPAEVRDFHFANARHSQAEGRAVGLHTPPTPAMGASAHNNSLTGQCHVSASCAEVGDGMKE